MIRLNNNTELYFNKKTKKALFVKRESGKIFEFDCDSVGTELIQHLKNKTHLLELTNISKFNDLINNLKLLDLITLEPAPNINHPRRSQLQAFSELDLHPEKTQSKIETAKIIIIGAGATGGWVAIQLAALGVKNFLIIDPDKVEESNLVRQPYKKEDICKQKTKALKQKLHLEYPSLAIETSDLEINESSNFAILFNKYDYVFIAGDYPSRSELSRIVSNACCNLNITHFICGGYGGHSGALGLTVIPKQTPCWECYLFHIKSRVPNLISEEYLVDSGPKNPSGILPTVLISASATVLEFIRVVGTNKPIFNGKQFDLNLTWKLTETAFSKNPNCINCEVKSYVR